MGKNFYYLNKITVNVMFLIASVIIVLTSCQTVNKEKQSSYAEDRALIEDLQARYMFALDNDDLDTYVATFTEDGILDIGEGEWKGREVIKKILESIPDQEPKTKDTTLHRSTGRHNITNIVLKIEGDSAWGRAYWFHMSNDNPRRSADLDSYGHYEDVMVKVDKQWLFSKRKIFNEEIRRWAAPEGNPAW
jgi:ketosteroid isomerase-like protein